MKMWSSLFTKQLLPHSKPDEIGLFTSQTTGVAGLLLL